MRKNTKKTKGLFQEGGEGGGATWDNQNPVPKHCDYR